MTLKRKLDITTDDVEPVTHKQLKLIPFPNFQPDDDVPMSDAEPYTHHLRIPSNASSTSSNASDSPLSHSPAYPSFDLYPLPFFNSQGTVDLNSHNYSHYASQSPISPVIGLMQPSATFTHHGTNCTQIPKLRMACASGPNGQRSMWSLCEQCGAISMIDKD